ncbi:type VII secretion protein EccB [Actinotignum urinale]|uniref:type VII secretion protein EccB n=1 Tax=Actinotignum urinale TaxID=190146 RepID=UPI000C80D349|nr:type VII secretion protein EccB [Actinotignum urinale]WIK59479.1 type VII secretion protein EccB [Actinotignum urinale]
MEHNTLANEKTFDATTIPVVIFINKHRVHCRIPRGEPLIASLPDVFSQSVSLHDETCEHVAITRHNRWTHSWRLRRDSAQNLPIHLSPQALGLLPHDKLTVKIKHFEEPWDDIAPAVAHMLSTNPRFLHKLVDYSALSNNSSVNMGMIPMLKKIAYGLVATILSLVGLWAYRLWAGNLPQGWENNRIIIDDDSGQVYLSHKGKLRPATNLTSAYLASNQHVTPLHVRASALENIPISSPLPPPGGSEKRDFIPHQPPKNITPSTHVLEACSSNNNVIIRTALKKSRARSKQSGDFIVEAQGKLWFISSDTKYYLNIPRERLPRLFNVEAIFPLSVSTQLIDLIPSGPDIEPLNMEGLGEVIEGLRFGKVRVGDILTMSSSTEKRDNTYFVMEKNGSLQPLTPFSFRLYLVSVDEKHVKMWHINDADIAGLERRESALLNRLPSEVNLASARIPPGTTPSNPPASATSATNISTVKSSSFNLSSGIFSYSTSSAFTQANTSLSTSISSELGENTPRGKAERVEIVNEQTARRRTLRGKIINTQTPREQNAQEQITQEQITQEQITQEQIAQEQTDFCVALSTFDNPPSAYLKKSTPDTFSSQHHGLLLSSNDKKDGSYVVTGEGKLMHATDTNLFISRFEYEQKNIVKVPPGWIKIINNHPNLVRVDK